LETLDTRLNEQVTRYLQIDLAKLIVCTIKRLKVKKLGGVWGKIRCMSPVPFLHGTVLDVIGCFLKGSHDMPGSCEGIR